MFPDELFADLFSRPGPLLCAALDGGHGDGVAAAGGVSDRDAVERFAFDARWR